MNLVQTDTDLFYWINQHHCTASDWMLWVASQSWSWAVVLLLAITFTTLRHEPRRWWLVLLGIALCFLIADRTSVYIKYLVCRPRPCHALEGVRMFRTSCGGEYGFVSSHAANVFALAMFLVLRYRKSLTRSRLLHNVLPHSRYHHLLFPILMFLWAVVVAYSRPYLGKHYPGDVICGGLLGLAIGMIVFLIMQLIEKLTHYAIKRKKVA